MTYDEYKQQNQKFYEDVLSKYNKFNSEASFVNGDEKISVELAIIIAYETELNLQEIVIPPKQKTA